MMVMMVNTIWISLRNQVRDKLVSGRGIGRQGTNFSSFPRFEPSFFESSSSEEYILEDLKSVLLEYEIYTSLQLDNQRKCNNPSRTTQFNKLQDISDNQTICQLITDNW